MIDTVICGDSLEVMRTFPTGFFYSVITSPPFWGLRDYGTARWVGGSPDCDHKPPDDAGHTNKPTAGQRHHAGRFAGETCWECGAKRIDKQLGLEKTPEEYVAKMVEVFREVWRVLRDDGTLWLNLGDSYASGGRGGGQDGPAGEKQRSNHGALLGAKTPPPGLKPKDLCGIPWRVAFALQADGWYLRQDIIWSKPNPMPESVTDRCTKAHEYIFLMTKKPRYYYDAVAIREEAQYGRCATFRSAKYENNNAHDNSAVDVEGYGANTPSYAGGRNKRSVWTVPTAPYSEAHFATFPPNLILPCILAGCPERVCKKCGEPRRRIVESERKPTRNVVASKTHGRDSAEFGNKDPQRHITETTTTGWTDCGCNAGFDGGIVMDPFMGSGTVGLVAYQNNRHYIGIELNPEYCELGRIEKERDKYALFEGKI